MGRDDMPVLGLITNSTSVPSAPDFGRNETLETELFASSEITIQTSAYGVRGFCRYLMLLGRDDGHDFGAGKHHEFMISTLASGVRGFCHHSKASIQQNQT